MTRVNPSVNICPEPATERDLGFDVPAPPWWTRQETISSDLVRTIKEQEVNLSDPLPRRQSFKVLGNERTEQQGRHSALRNSMSDREPCAAECRYIDRLDRTGLAQLTRCVEQPVHVERYASTGKSLSQGCEY